MVVRNGTSRFAGGRATPLRQVDSARAVAHLRRRPRSRGAARAVDRPAQDVRRGEVVFHADDPADTLHLIVKGRFAATGADGRRRRRHPHRPRARGAVRRARPARPRAAPLRHASSRSRRARRARSSATTSSALRREHPGVGEVLIAILVGEVKRLSRHLLEALYVPADKRVLRRLVRARRALRRRRRRPGGDPAAPGGPRRARGHVARDGQPGAARGGGPGLRRAGARPRSIVLDLRGPGAARPLGAGSSRGAAGGAQDRPGLSGADADGRPVRRIADRDGSLGDADDRAVAAVDDGPRGAAGDRRRVAADRPELPLDPHLEPAGALGLTACVRVARRCPRATQPASGSVRRRSVSDRAATWTASRRSRPPDTRAVRSARRRGSSHRDVEAAGGGVHSRAVRAPGRARAAG